MIPALAIAGRVLGSRTGRLALLVLGVLLAAWLYTEHVEDRTRDELRAEQDRAALEQIRRKREIEREIRDATDSDLCRTLHRPGCVQP